jgi:hypothetical protein
VDPKISSREIARPEAWGPTQPGMAWHHIIPYWLLRDVWNILVDRHIATELPDARVAIRQYLLLSDRNQPNVDSLIDRIRAENNKKRAGHSQLRPLDVIEVHRLNTVAVWPAWNAVEGPRRRSDDPQNRYFDRFTSGLTAEEAARMKAIEGLYEKFQAFVNSGAAPGPASLRALSQVASAARPIICCDRPILYRPEMWVDGGGGVWRKRRDGERYSATAN